MTGLIDLGDQDGQLVTTENFVAAVRAGERDFTAKEARSMDGMMVRQVTREARRLRSGLDNGRRSPRKLLRVVVARLLGRRGAGQIANDPSSYETRIRAAVPAFDAFQDTVAEATRGLDARLVLDLGIGTGETARRVLELQPRGHLVGIDGSVSMANSARAALPQDRVDVRVGRLEDPLPKGRFDLVISALAVHHLPAAGKADLFTRIASALRPGGVFVLGDVVVPENAEDQVTPLEDGFDLPDRVDDQVRWLEDAQLDPTVVWAERDLAVIRAAKRDP